MLIIELIQGSSTPKEIPALVALVCRDIPGHWSCLVTLYHPNIILICLWEFWEIAVNVVNSIKHIKHISNTPICHSDLLARDPSKAHLLHVIQHLSGILFSLNILNGEQPVTLHISDQAAKSAPLPLGSVSFQIPLDTLLELLQAWTPYEKRVKFMLNSCYKFNLC